MGNARRWRLQEVHFDASPAFSCCTFDPRRERVGALRTRCVLSPGAVERATPHGPNVAQRDPARVACQDFYQYANRDWLSTATIPPDATHWGVRDEMRESARAVLREILESPRATDPPAGTSEWKVRHFYASCMDSARAEAEGAKPLQEELARIDAIGSRDALENEIARLHRADVSAAFYFTAAQDAKHSSEVIADASPNTVLGLPDRDYYLRTDPVSERTREAYVAHVARTLVLSGLPKAAAEARASRVMAMETMLAGASMTITEQRDPAAVYHKMTVPQLAALTPTWSWPAYFRAIGRPDLTVVNITEPKFFAAVDGMLRSTPLEDWKGYLRFRYTARAAPYLSSAFVDEDFRFAAVLGGARALPPRWKRCLSITDELLGEALGRLYVERAFRPEAKARMLTLVQNVVAVFRESLSALPWMSEATRRQALAKLDSFTIKIGYPDTWRDYSALSVRDGSFWSNIVSAREFETARQLAKIGRPVDRDEWLQTPSMVDAYFDQNLNKVSFTAGLLQPPVDQYDRYGVLDDLHIDGKQTLSENIADIGGVKLAYAALERALRGKPRAIVDGMTPEQRFFLAYARSWRTVHRPEFLRTYLQTNTHAPDAWRVLGPISNMPEFAQAFECHATDPMVRPDAARAQIW
jgi:putative endopeptidase